MLHVNTNPQSGGAYVTQAQLTQRLAMHKGCTATWLSHKHYCTRIHSDSGTAMHSPTALQCAGCWMRPRVLGKRSRPQRGWPQQKHNCLLSAPLLPSRLACSNRMMHRGYTTRSQLLSQISTTTCWHHWLAPLSHCSCSCNQTSAGLLIQHPHYQRHRTVVNITVNHANSLVPNVVMATAKACRAVVADGSQSQINA